jgi:hypothetical protein
LFKNKLTGTARSLKTSFQLRKKTQTVFFSPDPCMDVLIIRWSVHEKSPNSSSCSRISAGRRQFRSRKTIRLSKDSQQEHSSRMWTWVW